MRRAGRAASPFSLYQACIAGSSRRSTNARKRSASSSARALDSYCAVRTLSGHCLRTLFRGDQCTETG